MPGLTEAPFLLFAAIVLLAFGTEVATGFGGTVIALTLGVHLVPLEAILPALVPVNLLLSASIVWRQRAHVDRRLLFTRILPLMLAGLGVGLAIFERASGRTLQRALGLFVVAVALEGLWHLRDASRPPPAPLPAPVRGAAMLGAGVIHGIFASGGPLLVWALGRSRIEKRVFRATLSSVWLVLGCALLAAYASRGLIDAASLRATFALLPVLALALVLGEWAHGRLDETRFRRAVFALLLAAGLTHLM